jgi:hypothetical protein
VPDPLIVPGEGWVLVVAPTEPVGPTTDVDVPIGAITAVCGAVVALGALPPPALAVPPLVPLAVAAIAAPDSINIAAPA